MNELAILLILKVDRRIEDRNEIGILKNNKNQLTRFISMTNHILTTFQKTMKLTAIDYHLQTISASSV